MLRGCSGARRRSGTLLRRSIGALHRSGMLRRGGTLLRRSIGVLNRSRVLHRGGTLLRRSIGVLNRCGGSAMHLRRGCCPLGSSGGAMHLRRGCVLCRSAVSRYGARCAERTRDRGGGRTAIIDLGRVRASGRGDAGVLRLHARRPNVVSAPDRQLACRRPRCDTAASAVIARAVPVAVRGGAIAIDVAHDVAVHVRDCRVVLEVVAVPSAARVTASVVAVTVVYAAIVADLRRPIAARPNEREAVPSQ